MLHEFTLRLRANAEVIVYEIEKLAVRVAGPLLPLVAEAFLPVLRTLMQNAPLACRSALWRMLPAQLRWYGSPTFTTNTSFGFEMRTHLNDMLSLYVYYFGVWEPNLSAWISRQLSSGDTFVDVGANLGYYSLLASKIVGSDGCVVAIEASAQTFPLLMENIALNCASNIRAENIAVCDRDEYFDIFYGPRNHSGLTSLVAQKGLIPSGKVRGKSLPSILSDEELTSTRLVKIDVEGAEYLVIQGLRDSLARMREDVEFVIEISPQRLSALGQAPGDITSIFRAAGFNSYTLRNDYTADYYISRPLPKPPTRLYGEISSEIDVIFSRRDELQL